MYGKMMRRLGGKGNAETGMANKGGQMGKKKIKNA